MKKIFAIMLALIFVLAAAVAAIGATEGSGTTTTDEKPTWLPANVKGETKYAYKSVVSFDEEGIESRLAPQTNTQNGRPRCAWEVVETGGVNGKALKMIANGNTAEGNITLDEQDWSAYDGLMVYVDMSEVIKNESKAGAGGIGIRVFSLLYSSGKYAWTRNGGSNNNPPPLPDFSIDAYYLENGEWKLCDAAAQDGERLQVPEHFVGWMYIPFTSYITVEGEEGGPQQGIYASEYIYKIMLLSGPYMSADPAGDDPTSKVTVDEIMLVKLGVTNAELEEQLKQTEATTTEAPAATTTRAKATMATTTAKTTAKATEAKADATTAAAEEEKSGCGSTVAVASVMMIATAAAIPAVATKRRRK